MDVLPSGGGPGPGLGVGRPKDGIRSPGQFVGPLGDLANGIDISLPLSLAVAAVLFLAMLRLFPEPRAVYGPEGARLARTVDVPVPAITGPGAVPDGAAPVLAVEGN